MKIFGRQDRILLVGFALAAVVVLARPVRHLLDLAGEVDRTYGLTLVPALVVLAVFFLLNLQARRHEAQSLVLNAETQRIHAEARAAEMERIVVFGQALGRSLDLEAIHDVIAQQLPRLAGTDDLWVLLRVGGRWQALLGASGEDRREAEKTRQLVADRALTAFHDASSPGTVVIDGSLCLPLVAGGHALGVVGLPDASDLSGDAGRRRLVTAVALLGIAVHNAQLFQDVRDNSLRDGLTGCFNRTHALEGIETELRRARRSQAPTSVIMFDVDLFKQVNDRYGHLCGDAVLAEVGKHMRAALRSSDLKCRYGGEEFLVLLPDTPLTGAKHVAESLRREFADKMHVIWNGETVLVTASFGVAAALPSEVDVQAIIARADAALYRAKDQGRNCVRLAIEAVVA